MASCPTTPGHLCWDCAPSRQARPFIADGLSRGNPFQDRQPAPGPQIPFEDHWQGVYITRPSQTFDDAPANHDHFIAIPDPSKAAKTKAAKSRSSRSKDREARTALLASIPVTIGGRL